MRDVTEADKSALVSLFLLRRCNMGLRARGATAVTAGLRLQFARTLQPTAFLDAAAILTARPSRAASDQPSCAPSVTPARVTPSSCLPVMA